LYGNDKRYFKSENPRNPLKKFEGIERAAPVLFGEKGDSLLLGAFTLEALGLTLYPFQRKLYKAILRL